MRLHMDLGSGIAGDMFLAACLDLGLEEERLHAGLATLPVKGWRLEVSRERRGGLAGTRVNVHIPHEHHHRHLPEILDLIQQSGLTEGSKARAAAIFRILAEAEGAVHGVGPEEVHFHEVGAVDAIVDICGAALALDALGVTAVSASPLATGNGTVRCAHGVMPVPAPAVARMILQHGLPLQPTAVQGELATPTGVAILCHVQPRFGPCLLGSIQRIGHGLGGREIPDQANALRLLGEEDTASDGALRREEVAVLSAHIDDMNPEWYGPLWEVLFQHGALDVALIPMTMKKGRPGTRLEVVVAPTGVETLAPLILRHTTTLGVRVQSMERWVWKRETRVVETPWGSVRVKVAGGVPRVEHEDLAALARKLNLSVPEAWARLLPHLDAPWGVL